MHTLANETNLDCLEAFMAGKQRPSLPAWLQYLADAAEVHQNFEHIRSLNELSADRVIRYVHRTLLILERFKADLPTEMYWQLSTVLAYSETAKGGSAVQRKHWTEKGYNLMAHNEGSASIFLEDYMGYDRPLLFSMIKTHGLLGQYLRGETRLAASAGLVGTIREYYDDRTAKKLLLILNQCIIEGISKELWESAGPGIEAALDRLFRLDFTEEFTDRIHRLTASFSETRQEKENLMEWKREQAEAFLADKDLWYPEPAMHDLSFSDFWTILVLASEELAARSVTHLNFEWLMQQLHYDYKGRKHSNVYRKRVIEKYLNEYRDNGRPDTSHVTFKTEVFDSAETAFLSFEFSDVGEALIQFCVEAEKTGGMIHNRAAVLLFDLFGLRRDAYDRFNNEADYLSHMNSSGDDKRGILDYITGETILDVGPGGGVLLDLLEKETAGKKILGIDISENVIEALESKKKAESHSWSVIKGNALKLLDTFQPASIDTIIYSSIIHELFSYLPYEGKQFNHGTIREALESAFSVLKPGGRIIIRDGIMTEDKEAQRIIRFKTSEGLPFLQQYARDFKGRKIRYELLPDGGVSMPVNDAMEFLYTYTWGTESYAHEVNEQFGYFTPGEYRHFIEETFGSQAKIIVLKHYLQEGYTQHLQDKIDFLSEDGKPVPLPDSTCLLVIGKIDR